ncbi:DUF2339 domain-containing protein [Leucothrix sargassi]|nr:DUF2339 domain-containing protein [Leucothrix sargassi]
MILFIVLIALGAFVGALDNSPITGMIIGFLGAWVHQLANKVQALRLMIESKESAQDATSHNLSQPTQEEAPKQTDWLAEQPEALAAKSFETSNQSTSLSTEPTVEPQASASTVAKEHKGNPWHDAPQASSASHTHVEESKPSLLTNVMQAAKAWFVGGNPFVRAGIVLLFIGVVFLLRYSLEQGLIPVELRLAGAAAAALALLFFGWRLRDREGSYGLILQAGGIGLLYLTVFGALSLYAIIPATVAFGLLVIIVAAGVLLAVLQNSLALAMFATAGGFLAPLLTSTGSNNYIGLFSFYALLNVGITTIAWFKSWRLLNLLGFVFTFVIASLWGMSAYQPENFSTTEPFLILFFLLYVAVAVLFALRTPVNYKDKVDSTLVFGVPVIGFGMQYALVQHIEYGIAVSALVLGVFYLILCKVLWKRYGESQKLLSETFLSLGVIFATLAIPFAVDGALTSATWAIEGVGILWVSIRQQQWLRRAFAIFLHIAALVILLYQVMFNTILSVNSSAFVNGDFVALMLITISMLICSRMLSRDFEGKKPFDAITAKVFFFAALLLQWLAFESQIALFGLFDEVVMLHLIYATLVTAALAISVRFTEWWLLKAILPFPFILAGIAFLKLMASEASIANNYGFVLWPLALGAMLLMLYLFQKKERHMEALTVLHPVWIWLTSLLLTHEVYYRMAQSFGLSSAWHIASLPLVALLVIWAVMHAKHWPLKDFKETLMQTVAIPFSALSGLWVLLSLGSAGQAAPLPWIPLLNPLDIVAAFVGLTLFSVYRQLSGDKRNEAAGVMRYGAVFIAFMIINMTVLRVLHHYYGYAWEFPSLLQQPVTQTTLAIVWTLFGMTLAWRGNRVLNRKLWFAGAALLGLVVLKLFLVDFASSGTVARIISFISVGALLLYIGYLAPMPSATMRAEKDTPNSKEDASDV